MSDSIGQTLARTRSQRALSFSQVYHALHIKERYLLAMEEDRMEDLPSPVQGRGFLRLYWEFLNLLPEELDALLSPGAEIQEASPLDDGGLPTSEADGPALPLSPEDLEVGQGDGSEISIASAQRLLKEIGSELREQRRRLSLTLESIEGVTHIPVHYVRALEEGRLDALPSPVQARGMLHNYASFLDLQVEELMLKFADALQLKREEGQRQIPVGRKKKVFSLPKSHWNGKPLLPAARTFFSLDIFIILLVAVAAFVSLIWGASSVVNFQMSPRATKTAEAELSGLTQTAAALGATLPTNNLISAVTETESAAIVEEGPTITIAAPTPSGAPIQLFVVARQRAYMQVLVDGKAAFVGRVQAGTPYYFEGRNRVELISGNASALQVIYNQIDLGTLGAQGSVVHLIFSGNSFGTPTLTPSMTPTETLKPSRTPIPTNTYPPTRTPRPTSTQWPTRTPTPSRTPTASPTLTQ